MKRSIHKMDARLRMANAAAHGTLRRFEKGGRLREISEKEKNRHIHPRHKRRYA